MTLDNISNLVTALAAVGAVIASLRNTKKIEENKRATQEIHLSINSRMDELLREAKAAAHAAGILQQRVTDEEKRTNK